MSRAGKRLITDETGLDVVQQLQNIAAALGYDLVPTVGEICQNITGSVNNTGHTINSGEYFIANGVKYQATASIPNGGAWANSATPAAGNDLINALNSNIATLSNDYAPRSYATTTAQLNHTITFSNNTNNIYLVSVSSANGTIYNVYIVRVKSVSAGLDIIKLTNQTEPTHSSNGLVMTLTVGTARSLIIGVTCITAGSLNNRPVIS